MAQPSVRALLADVLGARERFIDTVGNPSHAQANFKPAADAWSIVDNVEHIAMAERSGTNGMWKALDGIRRGAPVWGGPVAYWIAALRAGHSVLEALANELEQMESQGTPLENIIYPHPISGPLNMRQRFEFLRFHLDRHSVQVKSIQTVPAFP